MTLLHLVRHGEAAARWGEHRDPGLSETGHQQAAARAAAMAQLGPLPVLSSPLARAQQTAAPLASIWGVEPVLARQFSEIPSPSDDLAERTEWLSGLFATRWHDWPDDLDEWRQSVADGLLRLTEETVVVTHFIVIISALAAAEGSHDPAYQPGYCSHTILKSTGGRLSVVQRGETGHTVIR